MPRKLIRKIVMDANKAAKLLSDVIVDRLPDAVKVHAMENGGITVEVEFAPEVFDDGAVTMDVVAEVFVGQEE